MQIQLKEMKFYQYWAWLWIALGVCSIAAGAYLMYVAETYTGKESMDTLCAVAVTLIVVGLLRIANCVRVLRSTTRRPINFDR